jgi:ligand-binding sensor domain-containing protein
MRGVRKLWRRLRRWWTAGALPLAIACGGEEPRPRVADPVEDPSGVPAPVVHGPPVPLALEVIDGRFGAPSEATDLAVDAGGGIWVAAPGGLAVRPPGKAFFTHVELTRKVTTLGGLRAGVAIAGHEQGPMSMVELAPDGTPSVRMIDVVGYVHDVRSLPGGERALVAGAMGLAVVESSGVVTSLRAADPPSQELWAVAPAADGTAWFATFEQLRRITGSAPGDLAGPVDVRVDLVAGVPDHTVALDVCEGGEVWAATLGNGVLRVSPAGQVLARYDADEVLPQDHVISIACETGGGVWLGSSWGGLVRLRADGGIDYHTADVGLPGDSIRAIVPVEEDGGRAIWIATEGGIGVYRGP